MNERIQELEAQCWEHDQSWTGVGQRVFNRKKFAELIVRECASIYEKIDNGNAHMGTDNYLKALQKHFGVKE